MIMILRFLCTVYFVNGRLVRDITTNTVPNQKNQKIKTYTLFEFLLRSCFWAATKMFYLKDIKYILLTFIIAQQLKTFISDF